ncbi:putative aminoglycoside phosphotransferase [Oleiphilus messinensis]|uniref:Putative aminoglycoside phosphotransferase n=1 Tax=Oleiphilus messinensis TaxID=141451 RepID=A0A1Y0IDP8_9GAMM|nr:phosphotransferase family protein [Oleiphilus messinensis]ARU58390.1 putative aminoglycoside phosphotransferase [Oleiphilus messinensis]
MSLVDQAKNIRDGEELDVERVDRYLKPHLSGLSGTPEIKQFPGGASNLTYLISYPERDLILRRPPFGKKAKSAHDMVREARIMSALKPVYPYVPEVVLIAEQTEVMDCDFYVMERLVGIIPRQNLDAQMGLSVEGVRQLCTNVVDKLIELHGVDYQAADLAGIGKGSGYVARQILGWSDRYRKAMTEDASDFEVVMQWLEDKMPEDVATCVIHNDFRFDNVVLAVDDPQHVIGVLDWEMATLGDPLMDLGNSLAYWVQTDDDPQFQMMRRQPTHEKGMMTRQQVVDYYLSKTGYQVKSFDFYEIYGLFRLAVIIQQIYYRYFHGQTKDKRFSGFGFAAKYMEQRCLRMIEQSSL